MADLEKLRGEYEAAEAKALKLQADKDEAMQKVWIVPRPAARRERQAARGGAEGARGRGGRRCCFATQGSGGRR
jgi:hypothetical protein